ncbi:uncharacterized protein SPAPADRAFT_65637 [Spathaspora passalidarum NRRL Y-27907]|uniref:AAA+ ATPase domain-containing protein n=1 Tax=Spathaspora passalidarum (strain NRRL Y-27907 / 11-Y1) TaxID=619300 RepID=G3AIT9_SPAPN|nr:uncharacterized protein SPAPADRAFT_65637 [Spathaspora passalidarum NRRL Y-27907]EGW34505.1 hypothetical protein SPAPADRAFT_65637 [Spathaspora passalidarum NRRL Y-27907]
MATVDEFTMEVDSINLSESTLFTQERNDNDYDFQMTDSLLFAEPEKVQEQPGVIEEKEEDDEEEDDILTSHISQPFKEVKLFNGRTVKLKPKTKSATVQAPVQGSYMDMDTLFSKANLHNTIKENNRKLAEMEEHTPVASTSSQIWTEKYRPTKFLQLCSAGNDKQYRLVLHWLKKWSSVVFGEQVHDSDHSDGLGRPHRKILLIHGPPGIGKTAVVHILAKQMGYAIQELNAANSMDILPQSAANGSNPYANAASALKLKILNALTSNSLTSTTSKPSCLVIDEIDSLANANDVVKVLNDLVASDQKALNKKLKKASTEETSKKSKKKDVLLSRPIICIANEIYSNQNGKFGPNPMDKLRPIAEIVPFRKPQSGKTTTGQKFGGNAMKSVKDHLMWINEREKLGLDSRAIGDIVDTCDGDIRACINYIQFNAKKTGTANDSSMDKQISWYSMVDELFRREPQLKKDENFMFLLDKFMNGTGKSVVSNSSSFDRVIMGSFNRYLDTVHLQDDSLIRPSEFSDWLGFYDQISSSNKDNQYSGLVGLKIWSLFSQMNPQKNGAKLIPNARNLDFDSFEALKQNKATVKRITDKLPLQTQLSLGVNGDSMAGYFLPYMSKLLAPSLSSKIKSTLSETEQGWVRKIASIVKDFNLSLLNVKDIETGVVSLQISPNWDSLTLYENEFTLLPSATIVKQTQIRRQNLFPLISAELERHEISRKSQKRPNETEPEESAKKRFRGGNSVDFFKGKYQDMNTQIKSETPDDDFQPARIWVKYHEGFSNAVRKNIGWKDIWLP